MKNFDIKRFGRLTKWSCICSWKSWLKYYLIWTMVNFFVFAITSLAGHGSSGLDGKPVELGMQTFMVIIGYSITWFSIMPSMIFEGLKTKQQRIGYFSLPATNLEKFVSLFIVVNVGYFGISIFGGWTADILRFIFKAIIGDYSSTMVMVEVMNVFLDLNSRLATFSDELEADVSYWLLFVLTMGVVYGYSLYLLGGALFRKANWLLTSIFGFMLMMFSATVSLDVGNVLIGDSYNINIGFMIESGILFALSLFNVWACYKVFTRMQVINNKWLNL